MASGGEHVTAAAGEETPPREAEQGADTELEAPSGWTKQLNPIRAGKFEVIFVAPTGEEIKTKRALTQYLKAHPGGPVLSEFNWGTGNTPRQSSWLSEKVKATESPEDEKPAKRGRPSSSEKGKKGKQEDAEEAAAESGDHFDAEEAKGTDVEMKDADNAQEEKKVATSSQEEKKDSDTAQAGKNDVPMVDATGKTEEPQVETVGLELPQGADAAGKTEEAKVNTELLVLPEGAHVAGKTEGVEVNVEVSELPKGADAAGKTEDAEITIEFLELPKGADAAEKTEETEGNAEFSVLPNDVSAPVSENKGDGKRAESEVAPLVGEKTENGPAIESTGPPSVEKKEEADSTINPVTPPSIQHSSNTAHTPTSSHPSTPLLPLLPEGIIEEIFLRFPPDEARALMRASLTSKTWIHILSSKRFHHRYVDLHGTPPLLGFFYSRPEFYEPKEDDTVNPFLSTSRFTPCIPDNEQWEEIIFQYTTLDCRHGRVLSADLYDDGPIKLCIWDPMTGSGTTLVAPRVYESQHAAVLCAVRGCDHLSCNKGNSGLVLVGIDSVVDIGYQASAYVFSTETGKWSDQSVVLDLTSEVTVLQTTPVLLDEKLYFVIQYDEDDIEDDEDNIDILMYDMCSHSLSLVAAPQRDYNFRSESSEFILLAMKNGNLGFAELGWLCVKLWSWHVGPEGVLECTKSTRIEFRNFLPMQNRRYPKIELLGSVAGHEVVFLATDLGIFNVNLNPRKCKKVWKREGFDTLFPFFSFYGQQDESVPSDLNKRIIQARMDKELTQAQLAQMINEELQVVEEYESGKAIPNQQIIGKVERALGTKLRGKK